MVTSRLILGALLMAAGGTGFALAPRLPQAAPEMLVLDGDVSPVHDPVMIKEKDTYYVFCTGGRNGSGVLPIRTSKDLKTWTRAGFVFPDSLPEWTKIEIPRANNAWAPDIAFHQGKYLLYYSVSSFGSRDSAIGLVTNVTLDPSNPGYKWVDEGMVVRSFQEKDDWNAIDANLFVEDDKNVWLNWGSFWGGIKMRRVDPATGKLTASDTTLHSLSSRPRAQPIGGAVEAPFIVKRGRDYYLFVSFDRCCRGAMSTYNIRVGRAERVTGPYVDRVGVAMTDGGGTLVLEATTPAWRGPGHQAVVSDGPRDLLLFHAYPAQGRGSSLFISTVVWIDGWPKVGALPER
jgi:arabinan endo-1,5-alpha-L-arabinosidase